MIRSSSIAAFNARPSATALKWYRAVGVSMFVLALFFPAASWWYLNGRSPEYRAAATFEFYPGYPVNAIEARVAAWALLPKGRDVGLNMVDGTTDQYEFIVTSSDPLQAAFRANAGVAALGNKVQSSGQGRFKLLAPAVSPAPRRPVTQSYYPLLVGLQFLMYGVICLAACRRATSLQPCPA